MHAVDTCFVILSVVNEVKYTESKKTIGVCHNFDKCDMIYKFFSAMYDDKDSHLTQNALIPCLVKFENSKLLVI